MYTLLALRFLRSHDVAYQMKRNNFSIHQWLRLIRKHFLANSKWKIVRESQRMDHKSQWWISSVCLSQSQIRKLSLLDVPPLSNVLAQNIWNCIRVGAVLFYFTSRFCQVSLFFSSVSFGDAKRSICMKNGNVALDKRTSQPSPRPTATNNENKTFIQI